jgi:hypothetical protein
MTTLTHHALPAVRTYEAAESFVVEIELPADEPCFTAELTGRILTLKGGTSAAAPGLGAASRRGVFLT